MAAALDTGTVTPDTPFLDTGVFKYGGIEVLNWDWGAWGPQTMLGCMQHSLNVCLSWVGVQLGPTRFYDYLSRFEIGRRTNIDLAGEKIWPLATPSDTYWTDSNLVTNSFGQGLAVTPLALTMAISAVANDGKMMEPHIVRSVLSNGVEEVVHPRLVGNPISAITAHTLTEMLAVSLLEESSDGLVEGYRVAGKTGTAEIATQYGYTESLTNASFAGWGPVDDPRFVVYVWLEKPRSDRWGSIVASPIFSDVVKKLVVLMDIPSDAMRQQLALNQ
jgi:cell division protein FtsI/penicillin-binding protein 2